MFARIRLTIGLALLLTLIPSITAFAKGGFSFVTIAGPNLEETVRATDLALTEDFFAFADFYRNKTEAPSNPGKAYEITRYYVYNTREYAFDRLHYYPDTGFVYYDGIRNGSSEYDGKWYTAQPGIEKTFKQAITLQVQPITLVAESESATSKDPARSTLPRTMILLSGVAGLTLALLFGLRFRKSSLTN
jgi:hypothetical protein